MMSIIINQSENHFPCYVFGSMNHWRTVKKNGHNNLPEDKSTYLMRPSKAENSQLLIVCHLRFKKYLCYRLIVFWSARHCSSRGKAIKTQIQEVNNTMTDKYIGQNKNI